jgi:adenylosuccinate synthase
LQVLEMTPAASFPDRDTVAQKFAGISDADKSYLQLLMENAAQDDNLVDGLHRYLDQSAESRFLNSLKLETTGKWIGSAAPDRLQVRLMEAAKSSQHPAYEAFRTGLVRSGGLERAYPAAKI